VRALAPQSGEAVYMRERGTVREWHAEDGWGVIDSGAAPGGCWVHFSALAVDGYKVLDPAGSVVSRSRLRSRMVTASAP
jgi:cold shock CspA family protein